MRGQLNGLALNAAVLNGSGAEGILFGDMTQNLDLLGGIFSASVDVSAVLDAEISDFANVADGSVSVDADTLALIADLVIAAHCDSIIDTQAVVTLDHHTLTIFMREPLRRHAPGQDLALHPAGASVAPHPGGNALARHGSTSIYLPHERGSKLVRH